MGGAIAEVLPAAVGLALVNPLPVAAIIVLLLGQRGAAPAAAFVAGWLLGMVVVLGVLLFVVPLEEIVGSERAPSPLASVVRLLLGALLLVLAVRRWRGRPAPGAEGKAPGWMASLERANPVAALGLGALLSGVNPKNLAFTVSAAVAVAQPHLAGGQKLVALVVFVLLASAGVAAPVLWRLVGGESASAKLVGWRTWLTANYATIMAVVFLLFGVSLVGKGLGGLIG